MKILWTAALIVLHFPLAAQDVDARLEVQLARMEQTVRNQPPPQVADFPKFAENITRQIQTTRNALAAHRELLALETLAKLFDFFTGVRWVTDNGAGVDAGGLPAFEAHWNKVNLELTAIDRELAATDWSRAPAALRAIAEAARGKIVPLMGASRGFAITTTPADGMYIMGEAMGQAEFAKFCASLSLIRSGKSSPVRSYLPELLSLQEKANAAFVPPRSIDQHPRFIALNSVLKTARELDASRSYTGALYQYLEASRIYGLLDSPELDGAKQAELKQRVAGLRAELNASKKDDSIEAIFVERAESFVVNAKTPDEWRSAFAIADQVPTAYRAALKPPATAKRFSGKTVELTLVRWPYT